MTMLALLKKPTAFLPAAMSIVALLVVVVALATSGARQPDEGAAAHLFQLLMVLQLPIIAFFLVRWLRPAPREARRVFFLQMACAIVATAPVYWLGL
jgi:hypothetical protein